MGINEMRPFLEDNMVQWSLLRFDFGEGAFKRQKILFLHINGELCPAIPRGKANELTAEVKQLLRGEGGKDPIHASLEIKRGEDATAAYVLERVARYFNVDEKTDANPVAWLLKEYERQIKEASGSKGAKLGGDGDPTGRGRRIPGHESAKLFTNGRDALKAVGEPVGPWNWVFVRPDAKSLELVDGGTDSVDGMRECATVHNDAVLFGLLRMGFGEGRLRRTKYVFVQSNGTKVSPVLRGRAGAAKPAMQDAMAQFAVVSVFLELSEPQDLKLEDVIDRVRRAAIIDDDVIDKDEACKSAFSVEAFRKALAEDQAVATEMRGDAIKGKPPKPNSTLSVKEAVTLLRRTPDAPLNWALFGPNEEWIRCRKSTQVAPTGRNTQLFVPGGGGFIGAHARARSSSPMPVHARHSAADCLDGISEARSSAKVRARSVYPATSKSSVKRRSTLESEVTALGSDTPRGSGPVTPSAFAPRGSGSPDAVSAAVAGAVEAATTKQARVAAPESASPAAPPSAVTVSEFLLSDSAPMSDQTTASMPPIGMVQTVQDFINPGTASAPGAPSTPAVGMESTVPVGTGLSQSTASNFAPPPRVKARIAGPLLKMSGSWHKSWQLRWFEVSAGTLRWWDCREDAESDKAPKGTQELVDMKVRLVPQTASQFCLTTSMGKNKTYVLDANASTQVKNAGWGIESIVCTVTISAADWVKALEQESILRRREPAFSQRQP